MTDTLEQLKYPIGRFVPQTEYTAEDLKEWINTLKAIPGWMDACIENMDEFQLKTPYRPGGWTVQQVVHHMADSHMNAFIRLKLALTEDNPVVKPYSEQRWAELIDSDIVPVNISVTMLHTIHIKMVAIMNNMQPEDWNKTFYHPEHQRSITLWQLAALYAWHSRHHAAHITTLRDKNGW